MAAKKQNVVLKGFRIRVSEGVYGDDVVLCLNDAKEYEKWILKNYGSEQYVDNMAKGMTLRHSCKTRGGHDYTIWMPSFEWTIDNQATLAHELIHVASGILDRRGVDISEGHREALAYLYSFFFYKFWNALKREYEKRGGNKK